MAAKRILVIEDEKSLAGALELKLQKLGYEVTVTYDGKQGLECLSHEPYDIALLDLMMPVMDGFEVLAAAQKLPAAPMFIVLSNLTQPDDEARCMKLGARKFFVKSDTSLATLAAEIQKL